MIVMQVSIRGGDESVGEPTGMDASRMKGGPEANEEDEAPPESPKAEDDQATDKAEVADGTSPEGEGEEEEVAWYSPDDVWLGEDMDIPEDIEAALAQFIDEGKIGNLEDFVSGASGTDDGLAIDRVTRMFAYIVLNHLEEILAVATDNIAEALVDMGKILAADIAKVYPELAGTPEVSGAACAAFLTKAMDPVIRKSYDPTLRKIISAPLSKRFSEQLAKAISSVTLRKELLARFKPDLVSYIERGLNNKLGSPEKIVGNRTRSEKSLAECITKFAKAASAGADQDKAEAKLAEVTKKSLDTHLPALFERAWKAARGNCSHRDLV
jgi:hypothetical protein